MLAELAQLDFIKEFIIDENLAFSRLVESLDKLDDSALARARGSDNSCGLSNLKRAREVVEDLGVWTRRVEEIDVLKLDLTL